ncbi:unnamed protein product (macronuclear) [Paramecium tetraurelia]|uniref:60S ribosomal protein L35 n=1 Tax=Paramecium tetraurelia TaxID=5888 RepID=A0BDZ9_PARTE|nr:uncharacterized protein GSPATT00027797001 [Paramecium tetraurelia]CAK56766.1 unnamed protein product [Paramecium tetraurelia]|eukprot:XP_001424164.1 hypothetical protein (macronuclear) [Paramecium tetraurelia strain d4-2]
MSQKFKVRKLREQKPEDLLKDLEKLKGELIQLRTVKVSAGNAQKLGRIGLVRKRIAKYLTVINEQRRNQVKSTTKHASNLPVDLRGKKTRAIRQRLTRSEKAQKTQRQWKKLNNFPLRKFALKE